MTQEDKELLFEDLCAGLLYGIKASYYGVEEERETWDEIESITCDGYVHIGQYILPIESVKPYLFPLSSMTEEQKKEWKSLMISGPYGILYHTIYSFDYLYKNHIDFRGLIKKGLALDVTGLNIYLDMGTNVYAIRKNISKEIIDLLQQKQSLQTYKEINNKIEENKIHIGKRSAGWKFLFNHNDWKYYDYTEQSIKDFLKSCDAIVTEYDEPLTVDEFWEKFVTDFKDGWNGEQYYTWEVNRAGREKNAFSKEEAKILYDDAKKYFWHEQKFCKDVEIPYDELDYRFSDCTYFC